jgi:hypothetical protein
MSDAAPPIPPPAAPDGARRRRKWRMWVVLASISIGWKVLVFTLGAAIPRWLINDGIAELPTDVRAYGRQAQQVALALWSGPIERHGVVRTARVLRVDRNSSDAAARCGGLEARVRAYTYFGIPYSEVRTICESGVVEYRVFRRRATRRAL